MLENPNGVWSAFSDATFAARLDLDPSFAAWQMRVCDNCYDKLLLVDPVGIKPAQQRQAASSNVASSSSCLSSHVKTNGQIPWTLLLLKLESEKLAVDMSAERAVKNHCAERVKLNVSDAASATSERELVLGHSFHATRDELYIPARESDYYMTSRPVATTADPDLARRSKPGSASPSQTRRSREGGDLEGERKRKRNREAEEGEEDFYERDNRAARSPTVRSR